mgnify:CR=1 FL=1
MLSLSFGSGINADDKFQVDYSQKLVNYYGTFGKDTAALNIPDGNMHLYGGFFETLTGFASKVMGYETATLAYHNVRHASSAVLGWVAILCAALFAQLIAGWRAGLFTLIIMLLSPRFVGDSLMNPKDIPFAAGYMMAIYNMAAVLERLPNPRRWNLVGQADLELHNLSSALSTLDRLGSYRVHLDAADGRLPAFTLSTLDGDLQLSGSGQWTGSHLRFRGEARAAPRAEGELDNLLNFFGRRQGALSLISIG